MITLPSIDNGASRGLAPLQRMAERQALEQQLVRVAMALSDAEIEALIAYAYGRAEVASW